MLKMRELVSNKQTANKTAETDEGNKATYGENSFIKADKKYLFKRIAELSYSFVQT
jgi:hypothetical protein